MRTILVTGAAGFIGSNFVRRILEQKEEWRIVVLDALTYAGNLENLEGLAEKYGSRYRFVKADIRDKPAVEKLFREEEFDGVFHFAAESHVDRSILGPLTFVETNVLGTVNLLEACRKFWAGKKRRFLHVSTDEVYGALGDDGFFTENSHIRPSSPYSASKAASDLLALSYHRTYGLDLVVTRCCNNYGPYQFPEKLIPFMIKRALYGEPLPVYGDGRNVRDWIHTDDHNDGTLLAFEKGKAGEVYNLGSRCEKSNIELVNLILEKLCSLLQNDRSFKRPEIAYVTDRPGHDFRYAIDPSKAEIELGFKAKVSFEKGIETTIMWYLENRPWWEKIISGEYQEFVKKLYGERG
jgi:dTDP-glucose 4,6-dehydratase